MIALARNPIRLRWTLVFVLVALNALDLLTTGMILERGGYEANPLMRPFVESVVHGSAIKLVAIGIVAALVTRQPVANRRVEMMLAAACAWYVCVVGWNTVQLSLVA